MRKKKCLRLYNKRDKSEENLPQQNQIFLGCYIFMKKVDFTQNNCLTST